MVLKKSLAAIVIGAALLSGCNDNNDNNSSPNSNSETVSEVKVATFNVSFDRSNFEDLANQMVITKTEQDSLINEYVNNKEEMVESDQTTAAKIIQIRNIAAIIQTNRPDVLLINEFNNDGTGEDLTAINGFQDNYLSIPQSPNSIDGGDLLEPIQYPFKKTFATNTGLHTGMDFDNDGIVNANDPDDTFGFGFYHGQYAMAVFSRFELEDDSLRTFQTFKWKDMPSAENPVISVCDDLSNSELKDAVVGPLACGDNWYTDEEWEIVRLSSKNHVDVTVNIPTIEGDKPVHLLLSHPTPAIFDTYSKHNMMMNRDEIQFWADYINGESYMYDDNGVYGGLSEGNSFIILGDLNSDPYNGESYNNTIKSLIDHHNVNTQASNGTLTPSSQGGLEEDYQGNENVNLENNTLTPWATRVDFNIPSSDLNVTETGVYWPAAGEPGRLLMNDSRIGSNGTGKDISSDHRMVWVNIDLNN
ncbi:endonuclease/exonuclease/phosphatase family protein [Vibrio sp. SS-MA-C1-2]|uniref:endonuclease/exonuclease/phosphatase family protein n=1 Tax=Vibrio sp. SS-MA-C1-2 TaxID=2908646 RepID=UPI001F1BCADE|nr:endonuclease/exonuclease/phosphatase family protein [Vibrio sp. SS-MA-C1-2]UJF18520.1 endonuclease/exonuclease/phosphatase family protein [Vibrio sp. SS-MA-C1-2]